MTSPISPGGGQLGQNAFLQLLATQMKYQDPMQPQNNSQFIAQLAQFSSLEQTTNAAQTDTKMLQTLQSVQSMNQFMFAHQLMGTTVQVTANTGQAVSGQVSAVKFVNGEPQLVVSGQSYPMSSLVEMK